MKVAASITALAFAASAVAVPAWDAPTTTTTTVKPTTTTAAGTWADWDPTTTTTTVKKTTTTAATTWADWDVTTTTTKPVVATTTTASGTWGDWEEPDSWTTTIVSTITTYVPAPTKIVHGGQTWSVTSATTLTITGWPLTISVPVYTKTSTSCSSTPVAAVTSTATWADWGSTTAAPVAPSSYAPSGTAVKPAAFTGAANALVANVGAGLAGVGAIAAFLL